VRWIKHRVPRNKRRNIGSPPRSDGSLRVKFLRFVLTCLATVAVVALIALTPPFQTWFARMEYLDRPDLKASVGSVSAVFGRLEVEDAKFEYGRAVLTLPSLRARLPLIKAMWRKQLFVGTLVAKDWILDLSRLSDEPDVEVEVTSGGGSAAVTPAAPAPEKAAAWAFAGILSGRSLPFEASLDGVDLDGEVIVAPFPGKPPVHVHVTVTGGGMAAGRDGTFVIDASPVSDDAPSQPASPSAHCRLVVAMDSPRSVGRLQARTDLHVVLGSRPVDATLSAEAANSRSDLGETYAVDLSQGDRHIITLKASFPMAARRFSGGWKVDLRDSDFTSFPEIRNLPSFAGNGDGEFDTDASFARIHVKGGLAGVVSDFGTWAPAAQRLCPAAVEANFDLTHSGHLVHFTNALVTLAGADRLITTRVKAAQAFDVDEANGAVKVSDLDSDWLLVSLRRFPLSRLLPLPGGLAFSGGEADASFTVRATSTGYSLRSGAPLVATGVSVDRAGLPVARDLVLSFPVFADRDAKQWSFQWSPLGVASGNHTLATFDAKATLDTDMKHPMAIVGSFKSDLDVIATSPALPGFHWVTGRSASGDFTASVGSSSEIECKLAVVGHDPTHTVTGTVNADEEANGAGEFLAPLKMAFGTDVSEVSLEDSWKGKGAEPYTELKLTSDDVALAHLRLLAVPIAAAGGVSLSIPSGGGPPRWAPAGVRDIAPFWGDWVGRVTIAFEKLRTGDQDLLDVGGTFEVDHSSIQLEGGHGELPSKSMANMEGSIVFDGAAERPYVLKGSEGGLSNIDSALLLPPKKGEDPVIEGHFTVAGTIAGTGINLDDLIDRTEMEIHLSSTTGIVRILATDIADVIPETKEPVSDALGDAGNFVGSTILGIKDRSIEPGKNKVGKVPQAVIDFTNQVAEIGYDKISVTAVRGSDRSIRLVDLEMTASDVHLKGKGKISYVKGLAVSEEPIDVELQLGVRDVLTKKLATAGLLSSAKDALGYSLLNQPVRFAGTLDRVDASQWHDLLAQAAVPKAPAAKADKGSHSP
jgi:hypothetical protein